MRGCKRMQKNSIRISDPGTVGLRNPGMLIAVDPTSKDTVSLRVGPKHICAARKPDRAETRTVSDKTEDVGSSTRTEPRAEWVGHIMRVRDHSDQAAFAELFRYFAPRIKAFLMKSGADATLAEECAQEVMATLWHKAHLFDPARASAATWIFTIARNRRIDALRKQRRPEPEALPWGPEAEPDQEDVLTLQQESAYLRQALTTLPQAQRDLIERAYFGDLSHRQIAAETGLPLGTIKSRIRLALERLRHAMR